MSPEGKIGINVGVSERFAKLFQEKDAKVVGALEKAVWDAFMKFVTENRIDPDRYDIESTTCLPSEEGEYWNITVKFAPKHDKELYR